MDIEETKNNDIHIANLINHKDGSATVTVECSQDTYNLIFNYGFVALLMKEMEVDEDADANAVSND